MDYSSSLSSRSFQSLLDQFQLLCPDIHEEAVRLHLGAAGLLWDESKRGYSTEAMNNYELEVVNGLLRDQIGPNDRVTDMRFAKQWLETRHGADKHI